MKSPAIWTLLISTLILIPCSLYGQLDIHLPDTIILSVNGEDWKPAEKWMTELKSDARSGILKYQISGSYSSPLQNRTLLKISPTSSIEQVFKQVILYYSVLDPGERSMEQVIVYPYFSSVNDSPGITCSYSGKGKFRFRVNEWQQIPLPQKPSLVEITIYNQIVNQSFSVVDNFAGISEELIKKIAGEQQLSPEEIEKIYKKVFLWQNGK